MPHETSQRFRLIPLAFTVVEPLPGAHLHCCLRAGLWGMDTPHVCAGKGAVFFVMYTFAAAWSGALPSHCTADRCHCFLAEVPVHTMGMEEASDHAMLMSASQDQRPWTNA